MTQHTHKPVIAGRAGPESIPVIEYELGSNETRGASPMPLVKSRAHHNLVFLVLLPGIVTYAMLQSIVTPVLAQLIPEMHTTQATATWLVTGYLLAASVATPILGRIGDNIGKERVLIVALAVLTAGSLVAAATDSIEVMIAARVLQGVGGGVLPLAFGIIREEFPPAKVHAAVGIVSALAAVGGGLGLVLAGPIVDHLNYHWLFWFPTIMTAVAVLAVIAVVPESRVRGSDRINFGAALLLSAWLVALLLSVSKATAWGWLAPRTLTLLAIAVVCFAGWVRIETTSGSPLIDMRTMRLRAVWTTNLVAFVSGVSMFATMTFLPQLIQTPERVAGYGLGAGITESGLYMVPVTASMFVSSVLAAPLAARVGAKQVVVIGSLVMITPFVLLAAARDQSWQIYLASGVLGVGLGLTFSSMSAIIVSAVPPAQTGAATGMNANIRTIGGAIGTTVAGSILTSPGVIAHRYPISSGYTEMFGFLAVVCLLATVPALLIRDAETRPSSSQVGDSVTSRL